MDAKGLMVGNYLKKDGIIVKIDARSIFDMFNENPKYEPIPFKKDWLIKLGFELNDNGFYSKGRLTYHKTYGWEILESWISGWKSVEPIRYVHQLQNLYFAISGNELTL
jgi:hypothetical protein